MSKMQINLPKTSFSMKANLPTREPEILEFSETILTRIHLHPVLPKGSAPLPCDALPRPARQQ